jgi:hypothetical protein
MTDPTDRPTCQLCGEPMPPGEEMFNFHGYSGPCPKPAAPAPSGGLADQPAEPSERELPQWAIDEAYAIVCELPWGWEENASDELTPDEAWHQMELAKRIARHWRPAVPDTDAYADAAKLVEEILGTDKLTYLQLRAERDRFQEGWIASNELVEHLRAEQKAWQAAMDQVRKLRVKQRPERTDWDRDDPDGH